MNVLVYVMDSVRADHVGALGCSRPSTPTLDRLAEEGVLFSRAYAQGGWTLPSAASLFSGCWPSRAGIRGRQDRLVRSVPWTPESFAKQGYQTVGFTTMFQTGRHLGFGRGFHEFHELFHDAGAVETARRAALGEEPGPPLSEEMHVEALRWIDRRLSRWRRPASRPFYMTLWAGDACEPYRHPESWNQHAAPQGTPAAAPYTESERRRAFDGVRSEADRRRVMDLYDGAVRFQDAQLGRFLKELEERGLLDETLLVVLADHGEMFFEHGLAGHGQFPWEAQHRIPLLMRSPQLLPKGRSCRALVETRDLAPTLLDYAGLEADPRFQGKSLRPLIEGDVDELHPALFLEVPSPECPQEQSRVVVTKEWKLVDYQPALWRLRARRASENFGSYALSCLRPSWRKWLETQGSPVRGGWRKQIAGFAGELCSDARRTSLFDRPKDASEKHDLAAECPEICERLRALWPASDPADSARPGPLKNVRRDQIDETLAEMGCIET